MGHKTNLLIHAYVMKGSLRIISYYKFQVAELHLFHPWISFFLVSLPFQCLGNLWHFFDWKA